ncbi:hypothetical protein COY07_03165 [Candidatus Peregrinibacteria bacterium CG_4_10_14_0_2_um_filter_43_11]|nr:MAG: hypothetical protein COY07_03165 [Candidatus Peregrinibacteria bacterium CG_4_10_14_0_2_um_filter_43_11]
MSNSGQSKKVSDISSNRKQVLKEFGIFAVDILYNAVVIIVLVVLIRSFLISPFRVIGASMSDTLRSNEFILIDKLSYRLGEPSRGDAVVFKPPITNKYSYKFEKEVTTDAEGIGMLDLTLLHTPKNVIYCQNGFTALFWFCLDSVEGGDIVFFQPSGNSNEDEMTWQYAERRTVTEEEDNAKRLVFQGKANRSYLVRIYDVEGPEFFVKRIIGVPGDTLKIENGRVYLKSQQTDSFVELDETYLNEENRDHTYFNQTVQQDEIVVPEGVYFVLGDNRNHSNDSRSWFAPIDQKYTPYVPLKNISGRVLVVLWPPQSTRIIPNGVLEQ